jgi:L-ascorbate metabolism protein UlaG (beta-lactamase superfamily)
VGSALKARSRRAVAIALLLVVASGLRSTGCASDLARTDATLFPDPARDAINFWGHGCCYIDIDGYGIVTDPVFDARTLLRTRKVPAPPPAAYVRAKIILISHAHDDHLSPKTIATFPESTLVLCPYPAVEIASEAHRPVRGMTLGDVQEFPGGRVIAVAAHHPGSRRGVDAEADGRALGYVVQTPYGTLYYSGDTDLFRGFTDVWLRYDPRILILSVSGHLHGMDAVIAARATRAAIVVPVHHGAFGLWTWGPRRMPRDSELLVRELGSRLHIIPLGGSLALDQAAAER